MSWRVSWRDFQPKACEWGWLVPCGGEHEGSLVPPRWGEGLL